MDFAARKSGRRRSPVAVWRRLISRADAPDEDLAQDVVTQLAAKNAFLANLAVFKASSKLAGVLLDERA